MPEEGGFSAAPFADVISRRPLDVQFDHLAIRPAFGRNAVHRRIFLQRGGVNVLHSGGLQKRLFQTIPIY